MHGTTGLRQRMKILNLFEIRRVKLACDVFADTTPGDGFVDVVGRKFWHANIESE